MIKLNPSVEELIKSTCLTEEDANERIKVAQTGLSKQYGFSLVVPTKFGLPITINLTQEDCIITLDYNKWYNREKFDEFEIPENSAIVEVTDTGVILSEESKYVSELDEDTVKFMIIDLNGVVE